MRVNIIVEDEDTTVEVGIEATGPTEGDRPMMVVDTIDQIETPGQRAELVKAERRRVTGEMLGNASRAAQIALHGQEW